MLREMNRNAGGLKMNFYVVPTWRCRGEMEYINRDKLNRTVYVTVMPSILFLFQPILT